MTSHSCKLDHSCSHVPISDDRASTHGTVHSAFEFDAAPRPTAHEPRAKHPIPVQVFPAPPREGQTLAAIRDKAEVTHAVSAVPVADAVACSVGDAARGARSSTSTDRCRGTSGARSTGKGGWT